MPARVARRSAATVLVALLAALVTALAVLADRRTRSLAVYAHRGFAGVAPENTVAAVRAAAERADGIEVDVRRCGSGELVCAHDPDLRRIAGADRRIDETDWETLRDVGVEEPARGTTGATLARLDEVLAALPDGVPIVLELKERGLAEDVLTAVDRHGVDAQLSSFDPRALAEVRALDDAIPLAYTFRDDERALEIAEEFDCETVHPRADRCLRTRVVSRAHDRDLAVVAWTVDSRIEAALVALSGADGVFADRPIRSDR